MIGGKKQAGTWKLDARFNKDELIRRIRKIWRHRSRINLYCMDALEFTNDVLPRLEGNTFSFFDPPYIENGQGLYLNESDIAEHQRLAERVGSTGTTLGCDL